MVRVSLGVVSSCPQPSTRRGEWTELRAECHIQAVVCSHLWTAIRGGGRWGAENDKQNKQTNKQNTKNLFVQGNGILIVFPNKLPFSQKTIQIYIFLVKMKGKRKRFPWLKDCGKAVFQLKESTWADWTQRLDTRWAKFDIVSTFPWRISNI